MNSSSIISPILAEIGGNDNLAVLVLCGVAGLIAVVFFVAIYVGVYQSWRQKNEHRKAMGRVAQKLIPPPGMPRTLQEKLPSKSAARE